jgi:hypothetical protein
VLHILQDPILASVPDRSLEFMNLSELPGGIFKKISHDPFLRPDRKGAEVSEGVENDTGAVRQASAPLPDGIRSLGYPAGESERGKPAGRTHHSQMKCASPWIPSLADARVSPPSRT